MTNKPSINVTPLIDVLLVLLIIFMIITPVKPTNFKAQIPGEPKSTAETKTHPDSLVIVINADSSLRLNAEKDVGTVRETGKLTEMLAETFKKRTENRVSAHDREFKTDLTEAERIEKTVFIKAPRGIDYGSVVKVIDAVKTAGASPISLQIDELNLVRSEK
ncbi:MAG: biopolymer transporter ExbD [Pyrinomonadaceae bacterium]|nr:biopolymer transporter ExbD [Pyrinomonadaceae bacterium]